MALPASYTPQVLRLLADAGLAEARAGRDGGYRLTRPPGEIPLLAVVEAAEGAFALDPARRPLPLGAGLRDPRGLVGGGAGLPRLAAPDHPGRPGRRRRQA